MQVYVNEKFGDIRATMIDDEVWFVGKDVAAALEYERATKAVVDHVDEEDRKMIDGKTQSRFGIKLEQRGGWLINESGLYSLILSSKLPSAKQFKRWVTSEVLPAIRKTGSYVADKDFQKFLQVQQNYLKACRDETGTIKIFIEYARHKGCTKNEGFFYGLLSKLLTNSPRWGIVLSTTNA